MAIIVERDVDPLITYDWTKFETVCDAVVTAVAAVSDDDPAAIEPLYESVDPDSLDNLFATKNRSRDHLAGSVEFEYHGYLLVVKANGRGYVYERDE